jgi:putative ABC transport system permease protein
MQVQAIQTQQYYEDQSGDVFRQLLVLATCVVIGIGAVFGAMNTTYATVAVRTRKVGMLRALGFSKSAILTAFVLESTFLALIGGAAECLLALPSNGILSAAGGANFAKVSFAFRLTSEALVMGIGVVLLMGIVGGLLPALRAVRLPITVALRSCGSQTHLINRPHVVTPAWQGATTEYVESL